MSEKLLMDTHLDQHIQAIRSMTWGDYDIDIPLLSEDDELGQAILALKNELHHRAQRQKIIDEITARINSGLLLEDILDRLYYDLRAVIPFNRISVSLIDQNDQSVYSVWQKSDYDNVRLGNGFTAPLAGSSLQTIIETGQPRIIADLEHYLSQKVESVSTRLILEEGIQSSLTCPLIAQGMPVGFIFFSSSQTNTYTEEHLSFFQRIADQLSVIIEKGWLTSGMAQQAQAIKVQNHELQRFNELRNTFLGIAAHDLRHPVGYIQLAAQLLMDESLEPTGLDTLEIIEGIQKQVDHMICLIDELLDVTSLDAGEVTLKKGLIEMKYFLGEVVARHTQNAAVKGTQIFLDHVPDGMGMADHHRLNQVIDNLVSNAIKYSPPGSEIKVSARKSEQGWKVFVQDQGPGITFEDRERLFQDFARLSAKPTGGEKSTGLGLAIARRVVEAHGGEIGVDDAPGGGSIFWFTLPM
jgi:hypothetical protein